jgi:hypothetical protein
VRFGVREGIRWMEWDGKVLGMLRWAGKSGCGGGFGVENTRGKLRQELILIGAFGSTYPKKIILGGLSRNGYGFQDF